MPEQLVVGKIQELYKEVRAAWNAFDQAEDELEKLREEIKRLKLKSAQLERKKK